MISKAFTNDILHYKRWAYPQLRHIARILKSIYSDPCAEIEDEFIQCVVNNQVIFKEGDGTEEAKKMWSSSKLHSADPNSFVYVLNGEEDIEIFKLMASCLTADRHLVSHFISRFLFAQGYFWTYAEGESSWNYCKEVYQYAELESLLKTEEVISVSDAIVQNALLHCIQVISNILGPCHPVLEMAMSLAFSGTEKVIDKCICVMCLIPNNETVSRAFFGY